MTRESSYHTLILKKQPLGEGDELITVFTEEQGKLRVMAKSVKLAKSKLSPSLQSLFLVRLTVTHSALPKVIGAEVLKTFAGLREREQTVNMAAYAAELLLKFSPDEQPSPAMYKSVVDFLSFLDGGHSGAILNYGLIKFKIMFLDAAGFAVQYSPKLLNEKRVGFSNSYGGFYSSQAVDYLPVAGDVVHQFSIISKTLFDDLASLPQMGDSRELQNLLSDFLRYHLEREIKSEEALGMFLKSEV